MNKGFVTGFLALWLTGCATSTIIDEYRTTDSQLLVGETDKLVVLGRREAGDYETEPDFIACIGGKIATAGDIQVVPELVFVNQLYPWFEPRTAPQQLKRMARMLEDPLIRDQIRQQGIRYMIWVDGNTEVVSKEGTLSCAVGPGGGGCYGFATWDKASNYEATIWDLRELNEKGRVKVDTSGTSYMIAIGAPIPFIARVQGEACEGIGNQIRGFFSTQAETGPDK